MKNKTLQEFIKEYVESYLRGNKYCIVNVYYEYSKEIATYKLPIGDTCTFELVKELYSEFIKFNEDNHIFNYIFL